MTDAFIPCTIVQLEDDALVAAAQTACRINPMNRPLLLNRAEALGFVPDAAFAAILTDRKWQTSGVHLSVSFLDTPPAELRRRILAHMNAWSENANIAFSETAGVGQVRISREPTGHWSRLGTDVLLASDDQATMNLQGFSLTTGEAELRRVVRHETGHTLGFPHEHLRRAVVDRLLPDRVIAFYAARFGWSEKQTRQQVLTPLSEAAIVGTAVDEDSIMCYEMPGSLTTDGKPVHGGDDINARDHDFAAACYPRV